MGSSRKERFPGFTRFTQKTRQWRTISPWITYYCIPEVLPPAGLLKDKFKSVGRQKKTGTLNTDREAIIG